MTNQDKLQALIGEKKGKYDSVTNYSSFINIKSK